MKNKDKDNYIKKRAYIRESCIFNTFSRTVYISKNKNQDDLH